MNVYLESVGCRVNRSEVEELAREFSAAGHHVLPCASGADAIIVNTCAVTSAAERKSRRCVARLARRSPAAHLAVIGCYASLAPGRCAELPGVAWVIPNSHKQRTMLLLTPTSGADPPRGRGQAVGAEREVMRTRAFLKAQDGCDNRCTYCITRLARGPASSRPLPELVARVQDLVADGYQEIVLTGVNLGSYGRDLGLDGGLRTLVQALLRYTDVARLRLTSLEPWDIDEDFFELWSSSRLCRQLHVPLQAGCDHTLRRMGRRTTVASFARLMEAARAAIPDLAVTTDLIVGFPGEDEASFVASRDFVTEMAFARLHVFPYSPRPGTAAARLPGQLPLAVRLARARKVREMGAELASRFQREFVGRCMTVLWERRRTDGWWRGLTSNYVQVRTRTNADLHNQLVATYLLCAGDGHLLGQVCPPHDGWRATESPKAMDLKE